MPLQGQIPLTSNMDVATQALRLTPQERFLYQHHLNNLYGPGKVLQPNGDVSTVLQRVVQGPDGRYYNVPSVWDGKTLDEDGAITQAGKVGWDKWPSYASPKEADARYEQMHTYFDQDLMGYRQSQQSAQQGQAIPLTPGR